MGFGSHLDPHIAINRALTEMNQFLPAVLNPNYSPTTFSNRFLSDEPLIAA
jgi:ribosomal protein S12 methylthiotransferase accessory factor YcaO